MLVPTSVFSGVPLRVKPLTVSQLGPLVIVTIKSLVSLSTSVTSKVISYKESSSTDGSSNVETTGASLIGCIDTFTKPSSLNSPSLIENIKLSEPLKLALGIYVAVEPLIRTLPLLASPIEYVKLSPSTSLPLKVTSMLESSSTSAEVSSAIGLSLTDITVKIKESCVLNLLTTSLAYKLTVPEPFWFSNKDNVKIDPSRLAVTASTSSLYE